MQDVLYAIDRINIHLSKVKSFSEYKSDVTVKAAVERDLGIIGEAVVQIKKIFPDIRISSMQKIISFRNLIIHAYDSVNDDTVWLTATKHLTILKSEIEKLLTE